MQRPKGSPGYIDYIDERLGDEIDGWGNINEFEREREMKRKKWSKMPNPEIENINPNAIFEKDEKDKSHIDNTNDNNGGNSNFSNLDKPHNTKRNRTRSKYSGKGKVVCRLAKAKARAEIEKEIEHWELATKLETLQKQPKTDKLGFVISENETKDELPEHIIGGAGGNKVGGLGATSSGTGGGGNGLGEVTERKDVLSPNKSTPISSSTNERIAKIDRDIERLIDLKKKISKDKTNTSPSKNNKILRELTKEKKSPRKVKYGGKENTSNPHNVSHNLNPAISKKTQNRKINKTDNYR